MSTSARQRTIHTLLEESVRRFGDRPFLYFQKYVLREEGVTADTWDREAASAPAEQTAGARAP